jgi:hypothetical protein
MNKIQCVADIQELELSHTIPAEQIDLFYRDLKAVYEWSVPDQKVSFEEFHTEDYGYGYIAVLDGTESTEELEREIGLTGGHAATTPEAAANYYWGEEKWTRVVVIYNDSYSMLLWIKNYDGYDSYTTAWTYEQTSCPQEAPF